MHPYPRPPTSSGDVLAARALPALLAGLVLAADLPAQVLGNDHDAPPAPARPRVVEPSRPFVLGQDNLAFANPTGAVHLASISGNCYAMAAVTRLFYRRARFDALVPPLGDPTLDLGRLADHLAGRSSGRVVVAGFPHLHAMSRIEGVPVGAAQERWLESRVRVDAGLSPGPAPAPRPYNTDELLDLYRLVTTVHYQHYLQVQAGEFLELLAADELGGQAALRAATADTLAEVEDTLDGDDLPLLLLWNPEQTFGHVVLGYKVVERQPGVTDVYVYDSNTQAGDHRDATVLRVTAATGAIAVLTESAETGALTDAGWSDLDWFTPDAMVLKVLPDPDATPEARRALGRKLREAREGTAYVLAAGDLIQDLTQRGPGESSLEDDLRRYLLALRRIQERLGVTLPFAPEPLSESPSTQELNRYLARAAGPGLGIVQEFLLPEGVTLREPALRMAEDGSGDLLVSFEVELEDGETVDSLEAALDRAASFSGATGVRDLARGAGQVFRGQRLALWVELRLRKGPSPSPRMGRFAPHATLLRSRLRVGDVEPVEEEGTDGAHRILLSRDFLSGGMNRVLRGQGILGRRYTAPVDTMFEGRGTFVASLSDTRLRLRPERGRGRVQALADLYTFLPVTWKSRGIRVEADDMLLDVMVQSLRHRHNEIRVQVSLDADFQVDVGLGPFDWLLQAHLSQLVNGFLAPGLRAGLEGLVEDSLGGLVEKGAGQEVRFTEVSLDAGTDLRVRTEPLVLDVGPGLEALFGEARAPTLRFLAVRDDHLEISLDVSP